jgi:hypothetical protein
MYVCGSIGPGSDQSFSRVMTRLRTDHGADFCPPYEHLRGQGTKTILRVLSRAHSIENRASLEATGSLRRALKSREMRTSILMSPFDRSPIQVMTWPVRRRGKLGGTTVPISNHWKRMGKSRETPLTRHLRRPSRLTSSFQNRELKSTHGLTQSARETSRKVRSVSPIPAKICVKASWLANLFLSDPRSWNQTR